jgi:5-methylcytosine-specific restriction endonuclease McrA
MTNRAPKGKSRAEVILSIVATDNTFSMKMSLDDYGRVRDAFWTGKCIHCNTGMVVTLLGETSATVEHITPQCAGGHLTDPRNLALACVRCNNDKGIRHDMYVGRGGRADEVITALQAKRAQRWRVQAGM